MENLELKIMFHKLLVGLLSIDFSIDYSINKNIKKILMEYLQISSFKNKITKELLLESLNNLDIHSIPEAKVMLLVKYENAEYIEIICNEVSFSFSKLSYIEKQILVIIDLICNSILRDVFRPYRTPFTPADFYRLFAFTLDISEQQCTTAMEELIQAGLIEFNECEKYFKTTNLFLGEMYRASTIPEFESLDVSAFELNYSEDISLSTEENVLAFSGDFVSLYLFSLFEKEKKYFWYSTDTMNAVEELRCINDYNLKNQYVWIDNYEPEPLERQAELLNLVKITHSVLIVSAQQAESLFAKKCIKVRLKASCLELYLEKIFEPDLASAIKLYLSKLPSSDKKSDFISEIRQLIKNTDSTYVYATLPDLYKVFKMRLSDEELKQQKEFLIAFDEAEFEQQYGADGLNFGNQDMNPVIRDIHRKLMAPCDYLRADKDVFSKVNDIIDQHPNIINKELLLAIMQVSLYLSKDNKIHFPKPIILVGSPGCGKSMFCRQLREALGQERDIFIPIGTGLGADSLMGITPSYKNAGPGRVLSSIWESMGESKINCLNPLLVLDEIEKGCYSFKNDVNQNIQPSLLQLFSDECALHFQDSFFQISIKNFFVNYLATANSLSPLPEPILNRCFVIRFRDYSEEEMKGIVIPAQYSSFRKELNHLVPESLTKDEIDLIYQMSNGQPRQVKPSLILWLASIFKDGKRQELDLKKFNSLVESSRMNYDDKQIGFYR